MKPWNKQTGGTQGSPRYPLPLVQVLTRLIGTVVLACGLVGLAHGKLPAPTEEQKAKAEAAKAKAAEGAKREAELLGKYQDRAADNYKRGKVVKTGAPAPAAPAVKK